MEVAVWIFGGLMLAVIVGAAGYLKGMLDERTRWHDRMRDWKDHAS